MKWAIAAVLVLGACNDKAKEPPLIPPSPEKVAAEAAKDRLEAEKKAAEDKAAPTPGRVDCAKVLSEAEVNEVCGTKLKMTVANLMGESMEIDQLECNRFFGEGGTLESPHVRVEATRHATHAIAVQGFEWNPDDEPALPKIDGIGDMAEKDATNDFEDEPRFSVHFVAGKYHAGVSVKPPSLCAEKEITELARRAAKRLAAHQAGKAL